jgi:hypothetical protein
VAGVLALTVSAADANTPRWQAEPVIDGRLVELVGGPCDGERLDVSAAPDALVTGVALPTPGCAYPGGRALYDPRPGDTDHLYWSGDMP